MKGLLTLIVGLLPLAGIGQNWEYISCADLPDWFVCQGGANAQLDTVNPIVDGQLFTSDSSGLWQYGSSYKPTFDSVSVFKGWITDSVESYGVGSKSWFEVKFQFDEGSGCSFILFEHRYKLDSVFDGCYTQYSCDGVNWSMPYLAGLWSAPPEQIVYHEYPPSTSLPNSVLHDTVPTYSGDSDGWHWSGYQLCWLFPIFQGPQNRGDDGCINDVDSVRIRFIFESDSIESESDGWMIRNIVVGRNAIWGAVSENQYRPLDIFPNPTASTIRIQLPEGASKPTITSVFDMTGRLVHEQPFATDMDVAFLSTGSYVVVVQTEEGGFRGIIQKE